MGQEPGTWYNFRRHTTVIYFYQLGPTSKHFQNLLKCFRWLWAAHLKPEHGGWGRTISDPNCNIFLGILNEKQDIFLNLCPRHTQKSPTMTWNQCQVALIRSSTRLGSLYWEFPRNYFPEKCYLSTDVFQYNESFLFF